MGRLVFDGIREALFYDKTIPGCGTGDTQWIMKYRRGKKYAPTAEKFIERLASKSSWTGKPYQILCPGVPASNSGEWLTSQLEALRASQ